MVIIGPRYGAAEVEGTEQKDWSKAQRVYQLAADIFPEGAFRGATSWL